MRVSRRDIWPGSLRPLEPPWSRAIRCFQSTAPAAAPRPIDLRTVDRHPDAAVTTLLLSLRCRFCGGGPMPRLTSLRDA
jgi:hypothetical protein